jgi:hypothetical protein
MKLLIDVSNTPLTAPIRAPLNIDESTNKKRPNNRLITKENHSSESNVNKLNDFEIHLASFKEPIVPTEFINFRPTQVMQFLK